MIITPHKIAELVAVTRTSIVTAPVRGVSKLVSYLTITLLRTNMQTITLTICSPYFLEWN